MISINNLYKEYTIGTIDHRSLKEDLKVLFNRIVKKNKFEKTLGQENQKNKIIALNNINLKISKGEIVGLIGKMVLENQLCLKLSQK